MGCIRIVTPQNMGQLRRARDGWKPVPSDSRYEEKIVHYPKSGRTTRMTRPAGQSTNKEYPDYPHYTESYNADGSKKHWDDDPRWDSHYSTGPGKKGDHKPTHKTAQATLDDLDEALRSIRSRS